MARPGARPTSSRRQRAAKRGCGHAMANGTHPGVAQLKERQKMYNEIVGSKLRARYKSQSRQRVSMQMLWFLGADFWESNFPGGFTVGWLDAMRPVLKGYGLQISRRLGWGPCAREMHFGTSPKFSGPKLVWLLQTLERCEFDCWHGMSIGVHSAPNGVKAACHAAMPMLTGPVRQGSWHYQMGSLPTLPALLCGLVFKAVLWAQQGPGHTWLGQMGGQMVDLALAT